MSAKHTEGPWIVQPGTLTIYTLSDGTIGTTNAIAVPCRRSRDGGSSVSFDEAEANARLIAAAPELLAALEACQRELRLVDTQVRARMGCATIDSGESSVGKALASAKAAIAKATGEA